MNSQDFRSFIIRKIRAFESWAWRDSMDNPEDWNDLDEAAWIKLFEEYLNND